MPYVARVSYSYNSALEDSGLPGYFLDAYVSRDGEALVDVHEVYNSKQEFFDAIHEIVPIIDGTAAPSTQELLEVSKEV